MEPDIAITELVANCWDAGASRVDILWPVSSGDRIEVKDNGCGMTREEFEFRWRSLYYDRRKVQGPDAEFPPDVSGKKRLAFGRNGVGRHAMFYFAETYTIESSKETKFFRARVQQHTGESPFLFHIDSEKSSSKHGTSVWADTNRVPMSADKLRELIGAKFVADPDFEIYVNGTQVTLVDLTHRCEFWRVFIEEAGEVIVRRYDSEKVGRTSKQHGVAWWVNRRLVGYPSWEGLEARLLDARTGTAKRYTYVVEADVLERFVKPDWTGFHASSEVNAVRKEVDQFIMDDLRDLLKDQRKEQKRDVLMVHRDALRKLPDRSRSWVAWFVDEIQAHCTTIQQRDLINTVQVLMKMEAARSGYSLMGRLAQIEGKDIDQLDAILEEWTVTDAKKVLDELRYRLDLIGKLEALLKSEGADELHELQPVFERSLWMFGPEFESVSFTSNRALSTVVAKLLKVDADLDTPRKRPDFVVLPDSTIGVYSCNDFDDRHEVSGYKTVFVLELKRVGKEITHAEKDQAQDYTRELRKNVRSTTRIEAFVLGSSVAPEAAGIITEGRFTTITPRDYGVVLKAAHARTFDLYNKLERSERFQTDPELLEVLNESDDLFQQPDA